MSTLMEIERMKRQKREQLRGMEELVSQGGFFRETIMNEIAEVLDEEVLNLVEKQCEIGTGFWYVADEVEKAANDEERFEEENSGNNSWAQRKKDGIFRKWQLEQVARCSKEKFLSGQGYFWDGWKMSVGARMALGRMNSLDERILYLTYGLDGKGKRSAAEIAALPEFNCPISYIEKLQNSVQGILKIGGREQEFARNCENYSTMLGRESRNESRSDLQ